MQFVASDRILIAILAALTVGSIGLKAAAGPPRDGFADIPGAVVEQQLRARLAGQGFATSVRQLRIQSPIVFGQRGACSLSVRDARGGKAMMSQFARDAASIGSMRYLYNGASYDAPPGLYIRAVRLKTELLRRIGLSVRAPVPVGLATSPNCGGSDFGLGDVAV